MAVLFSQAGILIKEYIAPTCKDYGNDEQI
jgi:hypothetical protein